MSDFNSTMNEQHEKCSPGKIFAVSAIYGVVICFLLYEGIILGKGLGINVPLSLIAFYAGVFTVVGKAAKPFKPASIALLVLELAFSLCFVFYNNGFMRFCNIVAMVAIAASQLSVMLGTDDGRFFTLEFFPEIFGITFVRSFSSIGAAFKGYLGGNTNGSRGVLKGILIALAVTLPTVIILLLLLSSADEVFKLALNHIFSGEFIRDSLLNTIMFSLVAVMTISLLWWAVYRRNDGMKVEIADRKGLSFNAIAAITLLVAVNIILWLFAYVQSVFLFGGASLPEGVTYSEYAREGFWQLIAASVLVFALMVAVSSYERTTDGTLRTFVRILGTGICLGDMGLLVSAFYRLIMYEEIYLFTELRLYAQFFMILIAVCLVIFLIRLFKRNFRYGTAIFFALAAWLLVLNFFNVDAFIAKENIALAGRTYGSETADSVDWDYLLSLSADAIPYYIDEIPDEELIFDEDDFCYGEGYNRIVDFLEVDKYLSKERDFRSYNVGREAAKKAFDKADMFGRADRLRTRFEAYWGDY